MVNLKYVYLACLYIGYMMHTYSRRAFPYVINFALKSDYKDAAQIGLVVMCQQIGYVGVKFLMPFILDSINLKYAFVSTMLTSSICLFSFSYTYNILFACLFLFCNGICLAFSWPTLGKMLTKLNSKQELSSWWSILNTSSNLASITGALITTYVATYYGWRLSIRLYAFLDICCFLVIFSIFHNTEIPEQRDLVEYSSHSLTPNADRKSVFYTYVTNPTRFANNLVYFSVFISRYMILDWYQIRLLKQAKFTQMQISRFLSLVEVGGSIGGLIAGFLADICVVKLSNYKTPRQVVVVSFVLCASFIEYLLITYITNNHQKLPLQLMGFLFGLFIYGPVTICEVISIESASSKYQGLSFSINSIYGNGAIIVTSYPLPLLAKYFGWDIVFKIAYTLLFCSAFMMMLTIDRNKDLQRVDTSIADDLSLLRTISRSNRYPSKKTTFSNKTVIIK